MKNEEIGCIFRKFSIIFRFSEYLRKRDFVQIAVSWQSKLYKRFFCIVGAMANKLKKIVRLSCSGLIRVFRVPVALEDAQTKLEHEHG